MFSSKKERKKERMKERKKILEIITHLMIILHILKTNREEQEGKGAGQRQTGGGRMGGEKNRTGVF